MDLREIIKELGAALYKHAKQAVDAEESLEAIEYLEDMGVFEDSSS